MIRKTINYTDFNGQSRTVDAYFNVSKAEIADHLDLQQAVEEIRVIVSGPQRELSVPEIGKMLGLVKRFIRMSHGQKSTDGSRFRKTQETWDEFVETGQYDAFLFGLFENPKEAMDFMVGVLPEDLRAEAEAKMNQGKLQFDSSNLGPGAFTERPKMSLAELQAGIAAHEAAQKQQ